MRVRRAIVALLASLGGAWVTAAPAGALESGVFVDPNSPAGREYSIPLDVSRGGAVGRTAPQGAAEPLFGVGIVPAGASRAHSRAGRAHSGASTRASSPGHSGGPALADLAGPRSPAPEEALIAASILVGGLGLGVAAAALRRRRGLP